LDWDKLSMDKLMRLYMSNYLDETTLRDLAKNQPWHDIWYSAKKNNGYVFNRDATKLSDEQRKLILWSSLYDNIKEYSEPPSDEIIKDDLRLDGWLIKQNREEKVKKRDIKISNNPKIN